MRSLLGKPPLGSSPKYLVCAGKCCWNWCPLSMFSLPTQFMRKNVLVHYQVILKSKNLSRTALMPHSNEPGTLKRCHLKTRATVESLPCVELASKVDEHTYTNAMRNLRVSCSVLCIGRRSPRIRSMCSDYDRSLRNHRG